MTAHHDTGMLWVVGLFGFGVGMVVRQIVYGIEERRDRKSPG